jgi:uncharacterized protein (TIGR03437 family)
MRAFCLAAWLIAGLLANSAVQAQTTTQITLSFTGTMNGVVSGDTGFAEFTGVGNVTPFGPATFAGTIGCLPNCLGVTAYQPFTVYLASGGSFQFDGASFGCCGFIGISGTIANTQIASEITGGTGAFQNASGSFTLVVPSGFLPGQIVCFPDASGSQPPCPAGFQFTGSGSITTADILSVNPSALRFSFLQGSTPGSLSITLTNGTSQVAMFSATTSGQSWLNVSPASSTAAAFSSNTATVTVDPTSLTPGTYTGTVTLGASGQQFTVPVNVTVSTAQLAIAISQTALRFQVAAGAGAPVSQSITVLNQGTGPLKWAAKPSTLVGRWLSVAPLAGAAGNATTVSVDPTNLVPGDYYGLVQFTAIGAANSPQAAVVVLNVLPASSAVPTVEPTGLIFVGQQGSSNPAAQTVTVSNPSNQSITVTPIELAQQTGAFSVAPSGSVNVTSAQAAQFMISVDLAGLAAGVYTGIVQFVFGDGAVQQVALALIVTPAVGASPPAAIRATATGAACTPTKLIPVSTALGQSFNEVAAWPTPLIVQVDDDCGSPMGPGTVVASFSTGDPPLSLISLGGGVWSGTWQPQYIADAASVVITVQAQSVQPALMGTLQINGTLQPNQAAPSIGGVVSTASYVPHAPLAPGAFASVFGENLAATSILAGKLPLTTQLAGAQALIAGRLAPIQYSSGGQINVLIPFDLAPNSTQQLIVLEGSAYSTPEPITIAPAQPAVFTQDQSGKGAGAITVVKANGDQFSADPSHPASAGDTLVIYCAGLGAVTPSVATGTAAPSSPPAQASATVTVIIGGQSAPVAFAGLTPTYAGLYQVNVTVPSGITPGPNVPLIITAAGLSSPPVTVAIR